MLFEYKGDNCKAYSTNSVHYLVVYWSRYIEDHLKAYEENLYVTHLFYFGEEKMKFSLVHFIFIKHFLFLYFIERF